MKNIGILLVSSLFLCNAMLFGQYPTDEKIQPYPVPIKQRTLLQRFQCDITSAEQWRALHQAMIVPLGESIQIESSGHDPFLMLPNVKEPRKGTFEVRIRMKNTMKTFAEVFWATAKAPEIMSAENAVRFNFMPDGKWYTYSIEFTTDDPLTHLRLDPGGSAGIAEIAWVELYEVIHDEVPANPTPWIDADWAEKVEKWHTISSGNISVNFDSKGTGAIIEVDRKIIGEIYPLAYVDTRLPRGGAKQIPFYDEKRSDVHEQHIVHSEVKYTSESEISFNFIPDGTGYLRFRFEKGNLRFEMVNEDIRLNSGRKLTQRFGPVFRPYGDMQQAVLCGLEYLEKGEHSSSTADNETKEHLRFAPHPLDVTFPFMGVVTDRASFGLLWDDPGTQAVFAVPDFLFGDTKKHHLGLYGEEFAGTLKIALPDKAEKIRTVSEEWEQFWNLEQPNTLPKENPTLTDLDALILWAYQKRGLPELPKRLRNDEEQRLLNLAAFEKSCIVAPEGKGWRHAALAGAETQNFGAMYGSDFVTSIWQLTGKLPSNRPLAPGGGHLQNPASYFLTGQAEAFRVWKQNESKRFRSEQRPNGSFHYEGKYVRGHWENTSSGHCGTMLYRLLYTYQILGEPEALAAALKGLEYANQYTLPQGAQVWELSLHTPDIMASSRMCMANVWAYEVTGNKQYLDHAQRWAITGLPFVYCWQSPTIQKEDSVMLYASTAVFGATNWSAPNWIGLPVQWCGLDYAEACFMLAEHDQTLDWKKIAEGILITAERMQYTEGPSIGLLPDSFALESQTPNPFDINPSVLIQQRRRLQGKVPSLSIAVSADKKYRVVSPYKVTLEGNTEGNTAMIEGVAGTSYQILVNGKDIRTIQSQGTDRIEL